MHLTCTISECWLCCAAWKLKSQGLWSVVWWGDLIWSGCLVWRWWSVLMVWFGGRVWRWSVVALGCGGPISDLIVLYGGLRDWFHGLIWRSAREEDGLVWRLKIEKITSWVYTSDDMAQLNVRELRKQKQREKGNTYNFFKFSWNFEKAEALNRKRFANTQPNIFRAPVTWAETLLIPMSNILVTIQTLTVAIYLRKRSRERVHVM